MNALKSLFLSLCLLASLAGRSQTYYQSFKAPDNTIIDKKQSIPGTGTFDTKIVGALPSDAVPATMGSQYRVTTTLEPPATYNWAQFGENKYYSPTFRFAMDPGGYMPINDRRKWGFNCFSKFTTKADYSGAVGPGKAVIDWTSQLQAGEGLFYATQNILGDYQVNTVFFIRPLDQFVRENYTNVPGLGYGDLANYKYFVWNLETNVFGIAPGQKNGAAISGWGSAGDFNNWQSDKNYTIKLETSGETLTLEQLAGRGKDAWDIEMFTRRASRMAAVCEIARKKANPSIGVQVSIGYSPLTFYFPSAHLNNSSDSFFGGTSNVSNIGGDSQGNITFTNIPGLGNWTVNLSGDGLKHSDFIQGYHYELYPTGLPGLPSGNSRGDFDNLVRGKTSQAQIWALIDPTRHPDNNIVAIEKGWMQQNRNATQRRTGGAKPPIMTQKENIYESGDYFLPMPQVQGVLKYNSTTDRETPRLQVAPYTHASSYIVTRFFAGNELGWGYYLFDVDIVGITMNPNTAESIEGRIFYNYDLATETAILAARNDLQPYEAWFTGSTLVEDPEVQVSQSGNYSAYTGTDALNYNQGGWGPGKPAYMARYKAIPGGGYRVLIMGGFNQCWTCNRTDNIHIPGLPGNTTFAVTLRGPGAQVLDYIVPANSTNQTFTNLNGPAPTREKAGWRGWVTSATN